MIVCLETLSRLFYKHNLICGQGYKNNPSVKTESGHEMGKALQGERSYKGSFR